jgi:predicted ribosomally synthesized peptide with SipW-like signal peptide
MALALAAVSALGVGVTMALFSATQTSGANSFASGTVSVGLGSGSASLTPCDYRVKYTGTGAAWLAVDIAVNAGTPGLYTATSSGLQLKIGVNGGASMMNGTVYKTQGGTDTTVAAGSPVTNLLVSSVPAATNDLVTFDVDYLLPLLAPNALQGGTATVTLTFHAVQASNQPLGGCVAGRQCSDITWG